MIDRIPKNIVRVHVLSEKPSHCTRCDGYLSRHTINVDEYSDNDSVYYECSKCARKYTTPDQYCKNSKCFICINKDEAQSLIDEFKDQRERIITLVSKVVACLKSEGVSIPGLISRIHAMNARYAVSVFELVLLKKPDGNYMLVLLSSEPRIIQKERSFKIWGYLLVEGRRLLLEVNKRGDLFYYDGYNYEVVRVEVINHELHDNVLNMLKERSTFGSDKKSYNDDNSLPDEEKLVYVYQRLNNACSKHNVETVTAQTYNVKNGCPVEINIFHCLDCDKYYVNFEAMRGYIDKGVYPALNYYLVDNGLDELYDQYNKYAGNLLFVGIIDSFVAYEGRNAWARITPVVGFSNPIPAEEIKSFISISKTGTMTRVDETAYSRLLEIVEKYNPGIDLSKISRSRLSTTSNDYSKTTKVSKSEDAQLSYDDIQSLYPVSCRVVHAKFGKGTVIGIDGDILTISFDSGDEKRLSADFCMKNNMLERVG